MKKHPGKNLGTFLHPPKAKPQNMLARQMKPHAAPVRQTKNDTPKIPVQPHRSKTRIGKHRG